MSTAFKPAGGQTAILTNLDTFTTFVNTAAIHVIHVHTDVQPGSGVTVTIKQNTTTLGTATITAPNTYIDLSVNANLLTTDTVSIIVASSTAIDQTPNATKTSINIHIGSNN